MADFNIFIIDQNEDDQNDLMQALYEAGIDADYTNAFDPNKAIEVCSEKVFDLIICDPMLPEKLDGKSFIEKQRQFYSINKDTPIVIFTQDIDYISDLSKEFNLHPESKDGHYTKILNPVKMNLKIK